MARRFKHPGLRGPKEMSAEKKEAAAEYLVKVHADLKGMVAGISIAGSDHYIFDGIQTQINLTFEAITGKHAPWVNPGHTTTNMVTRSTRDY